MIAERGISNKSLPLPLNALPLCTLTSPKNIEPLSIEVTTNPSTGDTDADTLPLAINGDVSESADNGISNKFSPLPLNDELTLSCKLPLIKVEPLSSVVTEPVPNTLKNPSGETDAVTVPLAIRKLNHFRLMLQGNHHQV